MAQATDDSEAVQEPQAYDSSQGIVVTGTLIRGEAPTGSNLIGLGEERIAETQAISANDLLATVPQVTNYFNNVPAADLGVAANQLQVSRPNIRQISPNNATSSGTLILVDGHRIASVGVSTASIDPDVVPISAIERVEVVTEGGSAIYGADAVAGVINFITRKRFDGVQIDTSYGIADDYWEYDINGIVGTDWGSGSVYAAYSYAKSDALFGRDRDFIRRLDYSSRPYTPDGRECANPNLAVNTTFMGIVVAQQFAAAPDFAPGTFNACDTTDDTAIIPKIERHGAMVGFSQDLGSSTTADIRAFYSKRDTLATSPSTGTAQLPASFTIPAAIPPVIAGLPRTANASFSFSPLLGDDSDRSTTLIEEWGVNSELKTALDDNWELRGLLNYSRSNSEFSIRAPNAARLNAAGASGAIDPLDIASANPAIIEDIFDNETAGQAIDDLIDLRLIAEGELFELPGGGVRLAIGTEFMHDAFKLRQVNDARLGTLESTPYQRYDRDILSAFGELLIPIFGSSNSTAGFDRLELSLAARYDDYEDFGGTFNPKLGLSWRPVDWVNLRGNWGTSFTAPTPLDQLRSQVSTISAFPFAAFVRPGDAPAPGSYTVALQGSQPDLEPQEAETWSIGFEIEPPFIPGLSANLSYYNVKFDNILRTPTPSAAIFDDFPNNVQANENGLTPEQLRAFGALAPGGSAVVETLIAQNAIVYQTVDFRTGNFGILKVEGLDFGVNYTRPTGFGSVDFAVNGNYQLKRDANPSPDAPTVDELETDFPKFRLRTAIGTNIGDLRAQVTWNHTSGYDIDPLPTVPVQDHVGNFDTVNLYFKYDIPADTGLLSDLSLSLNVDNVLDEDPPVFFGTGPADNGYANGFTFGRMFTFGLNKKFQ